MKKDINFLNERIEAIQKELKSLGENYKFEYVFMHRVSDTDTFCESIVGSEETYLLCRDLLLLNYCKFKERKRFDLVTRMKNFRVVCIDDCGVKSYSNSSGRCEGLEKGGTYLVTDVRNIDVGLDFELEDLNGKALSQNYPSFRFVLDDYTKLN